MSGFLKLMSNQPLADTDCYKDFTLIVLGAGDKVVFCKEPNGSDNVNVVRPDGTTTTIVMQGNAYVLSESGKTVASRGTQNIGMVQQDVSKSFAGTVQ